MDCSPIDLLRFWLRFGATGIMPVQALIRNRIPASTQLPKFQVFIDFNCAANLGEAAVLKRNGNCSEGGGAYH